MRASCRWIISLGLLVGIVCYIRPEYLGKAFVRIDTRLAIFTVLLTVPFLFCRIYKWFLLARQVDEQISFKDMVPDYLWGMAVGLVTPGRIGELARVRHLNISKKRALVFFLLEKLIEVTLLGHLCLVSFISLELIGFWVVPVAAACVLLAYLFVQKLGRLPARIEELKCALFQVRIAGCLFFSFLCLMIFCVQAYLVLRSIDQTASLDVILLYPAVLIGNLIPISIVALLDLAVPALIGLFMNLIRRNTSSKRN